jgi:hypothetical protein
MLPTTKLYISSRPFQLQITSLYKNKCEMIMIIKRFETFVSTGNLGLSSKEVHCSSRKLIFPWGIIMSLWKRSLSCFGEQLKLFFPEEQSCPLRRRNFNCIGKQPCAQGSKGLSCSRSSHLCKKMCLKFCLIITFAYKF